MHLSKDYAKLCFTNEWTLAASINPKLFWAGLKTFGLASWTKRFWTLVKKQYSVLKSHFWFGSKLLRADHDIIVLAQSYFGLRHGINTGGINFDFNNFNFRTRSQRLR